MKRIILFFILLFNIFFCIYSIKSQKNELHFYDNNDGIMLVSTIDGYVTALDVTTGVKKWNFKEGPILESPVEIRHGFTFITDPRNGQLYFLKEGLLSKLPFTIPELVKVSPCRSSDGILYAGNKKDIWITINPENGDRSEALSGLLTSNFCPVNANNVFIGKTEYHVSMIDTRQKNRYWNATFIDYSSHLLPTDINYPFKHYTSSENGKLITVDAKSGRILWKHEFDSVIVNMYWMKKDGIHRVPSVAIGLETFVSLTQNIDIGEEMGDSFDEIKERDLHQILFVGQTLRAGLYALSAFVDSNTIIITPKNYEASLLEGPITSKNNIDADVSSSKELIKEYNNDYILLGYHKKPSLASLKNLIISQNSALSMEEILKKFYLQQNQNSPVIEYVTDVNANLDNLQNTRKCTAENCFTKFFSRNGKKDKNSVIIPPLKKKLIPNSLDDDWALDFILLQIWRKYPYAMLTTFVSIFVLIIATVWMCGRHSAVITLLHNSSQSGRFEVSQHSRSSGSGNVTSWWSAVFSLKNNAPINLNDENELEQWDSVGKLSFNRKKLLGQGCSGTAVYEGIFDNRKVAVKRVMKEYFELVEREINHLRESDSHANVIRYFCSESDINFRYIALELCENSLDDYVKKREVRELYSQLTQLNILKQTSDGIAHLHIHRDVKPKNILMSLRGNRARVLISDFGLCKAIQKDHNSISKTGIVGTEGWIAPEIINNSSITCAVDVFSLGCVFYYVLTTGEHPFGDSLYRQDHILRGDFNLQKLIEKANYVAESLIEDMLNVNAKLRPTAEAVAMHPIFWSKERQLSFLMNVSDRIEKETEISDPIKRLDERNACSFVVGKNWFVQLSAPLQNDLRNFRSYRQNSVRDLLRAIRNKRHHYRELSDELKDSLGSIPDGFVTYFTSKFPRLLMHTYAAMTICAEESIFETYYSNDLKDFYSFKFLNQEFIMPNYGYSSKIIKKHEKVGFFNTEYGFSTYNNTEFVTTQQPNKIWFYNNQESISQNIVSDMNGISNKKTITNENNLIKNTEQNFFNQPPQTVSNQGSPKTETEQISISKSKAKKLGKLKRKKHNKASLSTLTEIELNDAGDYGEIDLINDEQIETPLSNSLDERVENFNENNEIKKFFTNLMN